MPVLIQNLPLKEDMEENDTVYGCILQLLDNCHPAVSFSLNWTQPLTYHEMPDYGLPGVPVTSAVG